MGDPIPCSFCALVENLRREKGLEDADVPQIKLHLRRAHGMEQALRPIPN